MPTSPRSSQERRRPHCPSRTQQARQPQHGDRLASIAGSTAASVRCSAAVALKFKISELLLSTLTIVGISLIFHFDTSYQFGIILGVFSSAFGALYTIYNKRLVSHFGTKIINYYQMIAGTLCWGAFLPVYLLYFQSDSIVPDLKNTAYLGVLSLFCTVGLYVMFAEVLKKIPAFTVNLTYNLEPVYAIIMAFLFFGESKEVNLSFYIGLVFIIASVVLQTVISIKKKH